MVSSLLTRLRCTGRAHAGSRQPAAAWRTATSPTPKAPWLMAVLRHLSRAGWRAAGGLPSPVP